MLIVVGTAGVALAALLYAIVLMGCRNPRKPAWTKDFLVGNVYVPTIIGLLAVSAGCLVQMVLSFGSRPVGLTEVASAVAIAAGGLVLLKSLRIKKHLADYAAADATAKVVRLAGSTGGSADRPTTPEPPVKPTSGRKAA